MNFTKIGTGADTLTKKKKKAIRLTLDPSVQKEIVKEDFEGKIWLFRSFDGGWTVCAPMKDDYKYVESKR